MDHLNGLFMCIFAVLRGSSLYGLHCASGPLLLWLTTVSHDITYSVYYFRLEKVGLHLISASTCAYCFTSVIGDTLTYASK